VRFIQEIVLVVVLGVVVAKGVVRFIQEIVLVVVLGVVVALTKGVGPYSTRSNSCPNRRTSCNGRYCSYITIRNLTGCATCIRMMSTW